jgi:hypothetical protein
MVWLSGKPPPPGLESDTLAGVVKHMQQELAAQAGEGICGIGRYQKLLPQGRARPGCRR